MFAFLSRWFGRSSRWIPAPDRKLVVYIGWPLQSPTEWKKAKHYDRTRLELEDGTSVIPDDVRSHLLVYPTTNEGLGGAKIFYPLPPGVGGLVPKAGSKEPVAFDPAQLEYGKAVCRVSHSRFRKEHGKRMYASTLHNISGQRIRIHRFAGFRRVGQKYVLSTVTGSYYTDQQFIAWYAAPENGWLPPGGQVTDDNNYGGPGGLWAYFGETEDGRPFVATHPDQY